MRNRAKVKQCEHFVEQIVKRNFWGFPFRVRTSESGSRRSAMVNRPQSTDRLARQQTILQALEQRVVQAINALIPLVCFVKQPENFAGTLGEPPMCQNGRHRRLQEPTLLWSHTEETVETHCDKSQLVVDLAKLKIKNFLYAIALMMKRHGGT